jgi:N utilization substance protein B
MEKTSPKNDRTGKFANRSWVRAVVFQILYQEELNPGSLDRHSESYLERELPRHEPLIRFAKMLLDGTVKERTKIDEVLTSLAKNWALSRMSPVDRSILRLASYEIMFTKTPKPVVINEAVELAKTYGAVDSPHFVNGILNRISSLS